MNSMNKTKASTNKAIPTKVINVSKKTFLLTIKIIEKTIELMAMIILALLKRG